MTLFEILDPGPFRRPALVVAFDGWVNAGNAGTTSAEILEAGSEQVVAFDSDRLFDYRDVRPILGFVDGVMTSIDYPVVSLTCRRLAERDVLVLSGTEPSFGWRELGRTVADLSVRFEVQGAVSVGGVPWAAPHTRPVSIITTASSAERIPPGDEHPRGVLAVPGSATSAVEYAIADRGIPTVGFWARVPNYIGTTYHAAALGLLERVAAYLGIAIDTSDLVAAAAEQRIQIDAVTEARPEIKQLVSQLEAIVDDQLPVSGDDLAAEIERYLRSQSEGPDQV